MEEICRIRLLPTCYCRYTAFHRCRPRQHRLSGPLIEMLRAIIVPPEVHRVGSKSAIPEPAVVIGGIRRARQVGATRRLIRLDDSHTLRDQLMHWLSSLPMAFQMERRLPRERTQEYGLEAPAQ